VLRFAYPGVNSFAGDEAHISLDALQMARGGEFVMAGQDSSVGIPFFPASVWLFAIPYAVSPDPLVATWFVSLISLLTVAGVWWLGRRWNSWAGLVAALYMAASPYAVFYGRSIWQPNLLAPLGLAWAIAAYLGVTRTDRLGRFAIGLNIFLSLFVFQVHFAGIALVPATIYLFVRFRWWKKMIPVLIGGALALAAVLPYVYYVTVVAPDVLQRYREVVGSGGATFDLQALGNLARLALVRDWAFLGMGDAPHFEPSFLSLLPTAFLLLLGLLALQLHVLYIIQMRLRARRAASPSDVDNSQRPPALNPLVEILLVWLLASPLAFLRHSTPVLIHYQLIALPALALLAGTGTLLFREALANNRKWFAILMIILAAGWVWDILDTLAYTAENRPPNSALSSILRESRDAAYVPETPILFFTHGDNPAVDGEAAVFKALLWERPNRILNGDHILVLPPYPTTLLATLAPFQAWEEIEASGLAFDVQTYPRRVGAEPFISARYNGVSDPQGFTLLDEPIAFRDGATLLGWRTRRVGPRVRLSTLWRVDMPREATLGMIQQFHHLWRRDTDEAGADTASGEPLAISDVSLSYQLWEAGDRVIVMADFFDIAPGTENLVVDIGHYRLSDMVRMTLADSSETAVRLGPFSAP
jgi:hypothetical protein